jgi:predicted ribosome quality control (RQC) complex YloA/Tae2 family protein
MDQHIIAGIGNIYADESLWRAGIHPLEKVENVTPEQRTSLFKALKNTLEHSELDRLWLSEEPPKVLTVAPSHVSMIKNIGTSEPDLALMLMALYWQKHGHDE